MPIVNFPFVRLEPNQRARPMLYVRVTNPAAGLSLSTVALIDTGSDECACPATFASALGLDLADGIPKKMGTAIPDHVLVRRQNQEASRYPIGR